MIQVWIGKDEKANVAALAAKLEKLVKERSGGKDLSDGEQMDLLRAFLVFIEASRKEEAEQIAKDQNLECIDVGYLPEKRMQVEVDAYGVKAEAKNTVFVQKDARVTAVFVDVTEKDFEKIVKAADEAMKK